MDRCRDSNLGSVFQFHEREMMALIPWHNSETVRAWLDLLLLILSVSISLTCALLMLFGAAATPRKQTVGPGLTEGHDYNLPEVLERPEPPSLTEDNPASFIQE